jgi:mevalonate kinase
MKIKVSAPGKLMLFGEHAVVYDKPCIVTAVSSRLYVELELTHSGFKIEAPQAKDVRFVEEAVSVFKEKYKIGNGLAIKTSSDFSSQYGFGSSSAVTVATLFALAKIYEINLSLQEIFDLGYQVTLNIQGVGSGFDIAAALYGGTIYFLTGGKVIQPLKTETLPLVIGYSGIKADTPTMIKNLKLKMKNDPFGSIKNIFNSIEKIVDEAKIALTLGDWRKVGQLMNENHHLLQQLGVSTKKLDQMCQAAVEAGAYGAKLSGAGGGDCMIALTPVEKREAVEEAIVKVGGQIIKVKTNAKGVKVESS